MSTKTVGQVQPFEAGARGISASSLNAMLDEIKRLGGTPGAGRGLLSKFMPFINTGSASVAFGCPMIVDTATYPAGVTTAGQNGYLALKKPTADGFLPVYLNTGDTVAQNEYGVCMLCGVEPFMARVSAAVTAIAQSNGRVGVQSGTATFVKNISGFLVLAYHGDYYGDGNLWATLTLDTEMPMVGTISEFWVQSAPVGYLLCDGSAFSETQYPRLYAALGNVATLPDIRGRATICQGTGTGLTARVLKATVGTETHSLSAGENALHDHQLMQENETDDGYVWDPTFSAFGYPKVATVGILSDITSSSGTGTAHQNMQPSIVIAKAMKY